MPTGRSRAGSAPRPVALVGGKRTSGAREPRSPSQIAIANEVFAPTEEEIAHARASIEAYGRSQSEGVGAMGSDGKLVDAAHMRLAANVLNKRGVSDCP